MKDPLEYRTPWSCRDLSAGWIALKEMGLCEPSWKNVWVAGGGRKVDSSVYTLYTYYTYGLYDHLGL